MVRGRGYGRGSSRGGSSYRGSGSNFRPGSSRSSNFGSSSGGNYSSSRGYSSNNYQYDSRSRDRFSSRHSDRHDDHKRSHRPSSRDRTSPDRKRSRHEDSRLSSSYSSSYRRTESSRSRQTPPPPSISGRGSSSSYRPHREESSHRHSATNDSMGPPKSVPPRSRVVRTRGTATSRFRGTSTRGVRIIRGRRESTDMKLMRKKLLIARQRDRVRRIKIARLTSSLRRHRDVVPRKILRKERSKEKKDDDSSKNEEGEEKEKKAKSEAGDEKDAEKDTDTEVSSKKDAKKGDDSDDEDVDKDKDIDDKEKEPDVKRKSPARKKPNNYIKLTCVHCRIKCLTFKEYHHHLYSRNHRAAMRRLSLRQKAQLSHMRMKQRNEQRDIETNSKEETEDCPPQFCLLCRLNYRQPKAKHQLSEAHRKMKKFLMPYCNTCHIAFKSPMMYEAHRCSLDHIRRKAESNESHSDGSGDEKEVDLKNFLTVDSVGEIDGHAEDGDEKLDEESKEKINVGAEHVKKTEAMYCDLCHMYFSIRDDEESTIKKHCATRSHLKGYLRHKEDLSLRQEAERVQRRHKESKEKKKESEKTDKTEKVDGENAEDIEEEGDKLWEGVDKDLGDLLREVGPDGQEDDEEDGSVLNINIERFDRFKNSEKQNGTQAEDEEDKEKSKTDIILPTKIKKEKEEKAAPKVDEKAVEAK